MEGIAADLGSGLVPSLSISLIVKVALKETLVRGLATTLRLSLLCPFFVLPPNGAGAKRSLRFLTQYKPLLVAQGTSLCIHLWY